MKKKSTALAYFLWFISIFGWLGFHRFYLGKKKTAIVWILTFGVFFIGSLWDLITLSKQVNQCNGLEKIKAHTKIGSTTETMNSNSPSNKARPTTVPTDNSQTNVKNNELSDRAKTIKNEIGQLLNYDESMEKVKAGTHCLIAEGGTRYHTNSCVGFWDSNIKADFSNWILITMDEAKERGLSKCRICDRLDLSFDEYKEKYHSDEDCLIVTLVRNRNKILQDNIYRVFKGDYVSIVLDKTVDVADSYVIVHRNNHRLGYISKSDLKTLKIYNTPIEDMQAMIYSKEVDADTDDWNLEVAIFTGEKLNN